MISNTRTAPPVEKSPQQDALRESFKDVLTILDVLGATTDSVFEVQKVLQLAVENEAQLRLLIMAVTGKK